MKKLLPCVAVFAVALLGIALPARAQDQALASASYGHYQVFTDQGESQSLEIAKKMEGALSLFNNAFHFDLSRLTVKLRVRIFKEKKDYDQYLQKLISETRSDFVFISYSDPNRSELVGFNRPEAEFNASLLHYGLIQFLNAHVPTAPLWLEEGMAAYLEHSGYDPAAGSFSWQTNYIWLETLKSILKAASSAPKLPIAELLTIDKARAHKEIDVFYPTAWGLVHFLAQSSEKRYNRILWDSISALQPGLTLKENSARAKERAFSWIDGSELQAAFEEFILALKSFNDYVKEGIDLYNGSKLDEAEKAFNAALSLRSDNHIPYYYLGLTYYQRKNYVRAAVYYTRAMELGIEAALINYALGVNAFADRKYDQAAAYLNKARQLDPKAYGEKADSLLKRIEALK